MQNRSRCGFVEAAFAASWYNNPQSCRLRGCACARTRPCAGAQSFENIEPCKTAAGAVLLKASRVMITLKLPYTLRCITPLCRPQALRTLNHAKFQRVKFLFEAAGGFNAIFLSGQAR